MVWFLVYNAVIVPILYVAFQVAGLFSEKVRKGIKGRHDLFNRLREDLARRNPDVPRVWFHVASLGEFEQAKPLLRVLKQRRPDVTTVVSFFSPSGYEHVRRCAYADVLCYLPFDSYCNAKRFIDLVGPAVAVVVRHDFWPNHLWRLKRFGVPTLLVNASVSSKTLRLAPLVKNVNRNLLRCFTRVLAVSDEDAERFKLLYPFPDRIEAIGDTRYDQVYARSLESVQETLLPASVLRGKRVLVAGSTWPSDEQHLFPAFRRLAETYPDLLLILVPHEPTPERLTEIDQTLQALRLSCIRLSTLRNNGALTPFQVILVDGIGFLANLYALGHIAFVGGSFGPGVHNVLEPAVYGIPVLFGPRIQNAREALRLQSQGAGILVENEGAMYRTLNKLLRDYRETTRLGEDARALVMQYLGATGKAVARLEKYLKAIETHS